MVNHFTLVSAPHPPPPCPPPTPSPPPPETPHPLPPLTLLSQTSSLHKLPTHLSILETQRENNTVHKTNQAYHSQPTPSPTLHISRSLLLTLNTSSTTEHLLRYTQGGAAYVRSSHGKKVYSWSVFPAVDFKLCFHHKPLSSVAVSVACCTEQKKIGTEDFMYSPLALNNQKSEQRISCIHV